MGSENEILEHVRKAESLGLREVSILGPLADYRTVMNDFAQLLGRD